MGLLAGLAVASLATGLTLSTSPALRSLDALAREPWWWVLGFGALLSGGLGWIAGDQRREHQRAHRTYQAEIQAEFARLADQEWVTRAIVRAMLDAVLLVDKDGLVVDANPEAERLFGVEGGGLEGRSVTALFPDRPTMVPGQELPEDVEIATARHADGSAFRVEMRSTALEQPPLRIVTVREDLWRRQLADSREALERREGNQLVEIRQRTLVLLDLDHGLREDLSRILRVSEELRGRGVAIEPVLVSAFGMLERLERLLDVTLWDRAGGSTSRESVPVVDLFDHVNDIVAPLAQRWGRTVLVDLDPDLGQISTEPSLVAGAVRCVVREVLSRTDGDVVIEVAREPGRDHDWLLVRVSLGLALPDDEAARLAALLESNPATLPTDRDASLSLGQRLTRHLGGRITLRPEVTERGATFQLSLPLGAPDRVRPSRVPVARSEQPTPS